MAVIGAVQLLRIEREKKGPEIVSSARVRGWFETERHRTCHYRRSLEGGLPYHKYTPFMEGEE